MAPTRKGKGKAAAGSDAETSHTTQKSGRGRNAYIPPPADPRDRPVLRISGYRTFDAGHPEHTKQVNKVISQEVRMHYPGPYYRYTDFPDGNKRVIKEEFLKHYQFADELAENDAWDTFRKIADKRLSDMLNKAKDAATKSYGNSMLEWKEHATAPPHFDWITSQSWPGLVDHWCSDAFASRSQRNAGNRASADSSGATTGSVNMLVHKQRFEQEHQREPRWSDELFMPTHTSKKTGEFISAKARRAQENYEAAMVQKYGEDRGTWPNYDGDVWFSPGVADKNIHGDNYGLGALAKSRGMVRSGGSSSTQPHSSQSYSSVPPTTRFTEADIDVISSRVVDRVSSQVFERMSSHLMPQITEQITLAVRAAQGGSSSHQPSMPAPQDDNDDDDDDDEEHWSDVGGDGSA